MSKKRRLTRRNDSAGFELDLELCVEGEIIENTIKLGANRSANNGKRGTSSQAYFTTARKGALSTTEMLMYERQINKLTSKFKKNGVGMATYVR